MPKIRVSYQPPNPTTSQKVTFVAQASDPDGIAKVNILVNARLVKECATSVCKYVGGPFPAGTVTYGANAYDKAGNRAWTGYRSLTVKAAEADTSPPLLKISHRPTHPTTAQRVTFRALASDPSGIANIELLVNGQRVKRCAGSICRCVGGPFPAGTVTYGATALDKADNIAWAGYKHFPVTHEEAPQPKGASTVSVRVTGRTDLVKGISAYSADQQGSHFQAQALGGNQFGFSNLLDGRYVVYPVGTKGKAGLEAKPSSHEVMCRGQQSHSLSFEILGVSKD